MELGMMKPWLGGLSGQNAVPRTLMLNVISGVSSSRIVSSLKESVRSLLSDISEAQSSKPSALGRRKDILYLSTSAGVLPCIQLHKHLVAFLSSTPPPRLILKRQI